MTGLPPKQPSWGVHDSDYSWHAEGGPAAKKDKLSIAVVCTAHSGHVIPILNICTELSKRGHMVKLYTPEYAKEEFEKKIKQTGSEFVPLDMQNNTAEGISQMAQETSKLPLLLLHEIMMPALRKEFSRSRPDVVLTDFATLAGADVAEEMNVPLLVNLPGPLSILRVFVGMVDTSTGFNFLGLHIARQRLSMLNFARWVNAKSFAMWGHKLRHHVGRGAIVLVQTIWGLDQTTPVYPNVVVTGPVLPPGPDLREQLAKEHVELHKFLRASDGVVYVTTGSLAKLHDWQVQVLYQGLKKTRFKVVWSLKEELQQFLPVKDDPDFFISKWTPQAELLQDPAVRMVITHCGWGGTLETLTAGKPIVAIPFFGDQLLNAVLMQDYGVAELIGKIPKGNEGVSNPYQRSWMTEDTVYSAVSKVIGNPSYAQAAKKLMNASQACGGVEAAAQQVEWAARYGIDHLKPTNFRHSTGSNPYNGVLLGLVGACACAGAFMYLKFKGR